MTAPQKYESPNEQLLRLAKDARATGLSFDEFWDRAVPARRERLIRRCPQCGLGRAVTQLQCGSCGVTLLEAEVVRDDEGQPVWETVRPLPRVGAVDPPEGAVLWPRDTFDRKVAYEAACFAKEAWRRAYEGLKPPRSDSALTDLANA